LTLPCPDNMSKGISLLLVHFEGSSSSGGVGLTFGMRPEQIIEVLGLSDMPNNGAWEPRTTSRLLIARLFRYLAEKYNKILSDEKNEFNKIQRFLEGEESNNSHELEKRDKELDDLKTRVKILFDAFRNIQSFRDTLMHELNDYSKQSGNHLQESEKSEVAKMLVQLQDRRYEEVAMLLDEIRDSEQQVWKLKEVLKSGLQVALVELTGALRRDSANMKIIAVLTALFLPGTFMAIMLTTPMFKWPDPGEGEIIVRLPFAIYWATTGSMTLFLGGCMVWLFQPTWLQNLLMAFRKKDVLQNPV